MKRLIITIILLQAFASQSQPTQKWIRYDLVLGAHHNNIVNGMPNASLLMADVIEFNGAYRMYYTMKNADSAQIRYADSPDGITWTDGGIIMKSDTSRDTTNRRWEINGPSVFKLNGGQYRMYYCTTPYYHGGPPSFSISTAISPDGTNFTDEGIAIDIVPYDSSSTLSLAGHGTYFENDSGSVTAVFSANASDQHLQPSSLYIGRSTNGLDFTGIFKRYQGWHDPIVVKQNNKYVLFAMYMLSKSGTCTSTNGLNWINQLDSISFQDSLGNVLTESVTGIGDIGGIVMPGDEIWLYTNYGSPSRDIALFRLYGTTSSEENKYKDGFNVYPNPFNDKINLEINNTAENQKCIIEISDNKGTVLYKGSITGFENQLDLNYFAPGVYTLKIISANAVTTKNIIKLR